MSCAAFFPCPLKLNILNIVLPPAFFADPPPTWSMRVASICQVTHFSPTGIKTRGPCDSLLTQLTNRVPRRSQTFEVAVAAEVTENNYIGAVAGQGCSAFFIKLKWRPVTNENPDFIGATPITRSGPYLQRVLGASNCSIVPAELNASGLQPIPPIGRPPFPQPTSRTRTRIGDTRQGGSAGPLGIQSRQEEAGGLDRARAGRAGPSL